MRPWAFSLLTLLAATAVVAVGCAALARPNDWWASGLLTGVLAAVGLALLVAVFGRGPRRAFGGGFALGGTLYLALVAGPGLRESMGPLLITSRGLAAGELRWHGESSPIFMGSSTVYMPPNGLVQWGGPTGVGSSVFYSGNNISGISGTVVLASDSPSAVWPGTPFQRSGQALFTLLAGLLAGAIAQRIVARRDRASAV